MENAIAFIEATQKYGVMATELVYVACLMHELYGCCELSPQDNISKDC